MEKSKLNFKSIFCMLLPLVALVIAGIVNDTLFSRIFLFTGIFSAFTFWKDRKRKVLCLLSEFLIIFIVFAIGFYSLSTLNIEPIKTEWIKYIVLLALILFLGFIKFWNNRKQD